MTFSSEISEIRKSSLLALGISLIFLGCWFYDRDEGTLNLSGFLLTIVALCSLVAFLGFLFAVLSRNSKCAKKSEGMSECEVFSFHEAMKVMNIYLLLWFLFLTLLWLYVNFINKSGVDIGGLFLAIVIFHGVIGISFFAPAVGYLEIFNWLSGRKCLPAIITFFIVCLLTSHIIVTALFFRFPIFGLVPISQIAVISGLLLGVLMKGQVRSLWERFSKSI